MPPDRRPFAYALRPEDGTPGPDLIAEWPMHQSLAAQRRALTPPRVEARPTVRPASADHQHGFASFHGE